MTATEISGAFVGGLVLLGLTSTGVVTLIKTLRRNGAKTVCPVDIGSGFDRLLDATHQQTDVLGKIHDKLIGLDHRTDKTGDAVVRLEQGLAAVHRRIDKSGTA